MPSLRRHFHGAARVLGSCLAAGTKRLFRRREVEVAGAFDNVVAFAPQVRAKPVVTAVTAKEHGAVILPFRPRQSPMVAASMPPARTGS